MAGRKAAHAGSHEQHDDAELQKGSPNVIFEGRAAWRTAVDEYGCKKDGEPEKVVDGATRVVINGQLAVRQGDFLLGAGAPNAIMTGAARIEIGESHVGMGSTDGNKAFCEEWCKLKAIWGSLTADQKKAAYKQTMENIFRKLGMPPPRRYNLEEEKWGGTWNQRDWELAINKGFYDGKWNINQLEETTRHETRHAEQTWYGLRSARYRTQGKKEGWISWLRGDLDVPRGVLEDAKNSPPLTAAEERYGATNYDANFTEKGMDLLRWANEDYDHRYPQTPWGADARQVETTHCSC
jgi:uncharacterized Zn-binding protein involved in type VI secretion